MSDQADKAEDGSADDEGSSEDDLDLDREFERTFPSIPEEFHCVETGEPFQSCIECQLPLIDALESPYSIAKVLHRGETILEWAMCGDCVERFREDISEESKQAVAKFLAKAKVPAEHVLSPPEVKLSYCYLCARPRCELEGYSLQAVCSGRELISLQAPFLICQQCEQDTHEVLSKATRDHLDRFYEDHFPGPPADVKQFPKRRPVVI